MNEPKDSLSTLLQSHKSELTHKIPAHLATQLATHLAAQIKEEISSESQPRRTISWMSFAGGLAACFMMVLVFQLGRLSNSEQGRQVVVDEIVSAHVRSLMSQHLMDVPSTDQHTVKPWFEGKIDFGANVKDFAQNGFPLIGGRMDYIDRRTTAALVYKYKQHVINVFEYPTPSVEGAPHLSVLRGYQVFSWSKEGISYWAVSDLNAADLQRFVQMW